MAKTDKYLYVFLFLIIIFGFGSLSFRNLARYYINREQVNNEWLPEQGNEFETDIASTFYGKNGFVNLNGAICKALRQPYMNGVVKLNNGYLMSNMDHTSDEALRKYADSTAGFNEYLKNRGIALVYACPPYTSSKYDPELPEGIYDYGNDNCDRFIRMLQKTGVDTIDFREEMHNDDIDQYNMMYKTDLHWNTEAGFYAYGIIEDYIVNKTGCIVDQRISDIHNYTVTKYARWHLGSWGQRTGLYYAGIDDFDLITPNFDTSIRDVSGNVGTMQDIMINMGPLNNKDYTSRYTYDHVLGLSLGHFENLDCMNDIKILTITDSFSKAVNPYLAMAFAGIEYYYDHDVSGITPEYIENTDPDVVVMLYYPDCLQEESDAFSFTGFDKEGL